MWSLDLSPATVGICYRGTQAAVPTAHRGERGASRRRGRASPVMQPVAGMRRTRRDGRSFPERQSLFLQHPNDPRRLYHGQAVYNERTYTHSRLQSSHKKSSEIIKRLSGVGGLLYMCAKKYISNFKSSNTSILGFLVFFFAELRQKWREERRRRGWMMVRSSG